MNKKFALIAIIILAIAALAGMVMRPDGWKWNNQPMSQDILLGWSWSPDTPSASSTDWVLR